MTTTQLVTAWKNDRGKWMLNVRDVSRISNADTDVLSARILDGVITTQKKRVKPAQGGKDDK